jgi:hypothetical protein
MTTTATPATGVEELDRQRQYVASVKASNFEFGLMVEDAFVRGIRDLGYKGTDTALDELIDNSLQANASKVGILFGFGYASDAKPNALAVVDDGHGMDPDMIRLAVVWGGTHREDDRKGFGRYGYGLPSACVSQGRSFTVFSRVAGADWHAVTLDLDGVAAGEYTKDNRVLVPEATPKRPPKWVQTQLRELYGGDPEHGTVVLIEKLDRIDWKTARALEGHLLPHVGMTYRNFLRQVTVVVNGTVAEPVDPLFVTPGHRYYDLDDDRAIPLPPLTFDVRNDRDELGTVKVRYAYLPPTFARARSDKYSERGPKNERLPIMKATNGVIVLRNGRQIDIVTRIPWTTFQNNDRYIKVEIDYPAILDEEFSITTSKQQINLSERMWDLLRREGVDRAIGGMRQKWTEENATLKAKREEDEEKQRASEQAMAEADKFKTKPPAGDPIERRRKSEERFRQEVERRTTQTGLPRELVEKELLAETRENPYKVAQRSLPGAPFFSVEQMGGQMILYLNTAHRFYTDVYAGPESTPRLRAALEVLLFVLGESELDSAGDRQLFYQAERANWSTRLHVALDRLNQIDSVEEAEAGEATEDELPESPEVGGPMEPVATKP